jgi:ABC-type dipeptide/oligopeptide/nickel transport system permease subunit
MNGYSAHAPGLAVRWFKQLRLGSGRPSIRASPGHGPVLAAMGLIGLMVLTALCSPWLAPYDPAAQDTRHALTAPSARHWLGTDDLGRDILSRIIWGTRISLEVGVSAVIVAFLIGTPLGLVAGYRSGVVDAVVMRGTDIMLAFPNLLMALLLVAALGTNLANEIVAIGIALVPNFARVARGMTLSLKENEYIVAAKAMGQSQVRVLFRHLLPNAFATLFVMATLYIATAIRTEASLSFLGLGVPPPAPSWGNILSEGQSYVRQAPWVTGFAGLAIFIAVLAFNLLGDALRDVMDPRLRGEGVRKTE